jgi:TolB-like protein
MFKKKLGKIIIVAVVVGFFYTPAFLIAQVSLDEGINALTDQINKYMVEQKKTKIAIIPFPDIQKQKVYVLGNFIAEELTTNLFSTGKFKIVERSLLKQVLDELKLGQIGIMDANSAKELGKMTGVDAIIAGTITDLGSSIAINCRLIETQSGEVFAAAKTRIVKDKDLEKMIGEGDEVAEKNNGVNDLQKKQKNQKTPQSNNVIANDFKFEVKQCVRSGNRITVELMITNIEKDDILFIGYMETRMTDNYGNVFRPSRLTLGNRGGTNINAYTELAKDIPTKCMMIFDVPSDINSIALLDLSCIRGDPLFNQSRGRFRAQLKNIPINN